MTGKAQPGHRATNGSDATRRSSGSRSERRFRLRVYIADDHPIFLAGLTRAIKDRPGLELVGSSLDGRRALDEITSLVPDVAVLDLRMPGLDGIEVMAGIRGAGLETHVLFLSAHAESKLVYEALAAGACGFLSKLAGEQAVCEAITTIARGDAVVPEELQAELLDEIHRRGPGAHPLLTPREVEILKLIAEGNPTPEIAAILHLSPATVRSHLQHVYEKLGVSSQAAAVAAALREKLFA